MEMYQFVNIEVLSTYTYIFYKDKYIMKSMDTFCISRYIYFTCVLSFIHNAYQDTRTHLKMYIVICFHNHFIYKFTHFNLYLLSFQMHSFHLLLLFSLHCNLLSSFSLYVHSLSLQLRSHCLYSCDLFKFTLHSTSTQPPL